MGSWGGAWTAPLVWNAWGLTPIFARPGYAYANPYYVAVSEPFFDYSQPLVVNTYNQVTVDASPAVNVAQTQSEENEQIVAGYEWFDRAREAFFDGDYQKALKLVETAIQKVPSDPVLHEFGALTLFALGDYTKAASVLNAVLAVAPGMSWTTMSGLFSDTGVYTEHLRRLEDFTDQHPQDAAAHFVLAYHYMVMGYLEQASQKLEVVIEHQPEDQVAKWLLEFLTAAQGNATSPAEVTLDQTGASTEAAVSTEALAATDEEPQQFTDLVGNWTARRGEDQFKLMIDEEANFSWTAIPAGQEGITLSGQAATAGDTLILESAEQGTMAGLVKPGGPDKFQFIIAGSPPSDEGLAFGRIEKTSDENREQ